MRYSYLLFIILLISCQSESKSSSDPEEITVQDISHTPQRDSSKSTITFSDDWRYEEDDSSGVDFFLMYNGNDDEFKENLNQVSLPVDETIDLNEFLRLNTEDLKNNFPSLKTINSERITVNGEEAQLLEYTTDYEGIEIYYIQQYMIRDNVAYVLTFSGDQEDGQQLRTEVLEIFRSFRP